MIDKMSRKQEEMLTEKGSNKSYGYRSVQVKPTYQNVNYDEMIAKMAKK